MQTPLESIRSVVASFKAKPPRNVPNDNPLLGFKCMVAPTNETARQGYPDNNNTTVLGNVQKLLGRIYATAQVAPSLHHCIRQGLQAKQISDEISTTFLKGIKSLM